MTSMSSAPRGRSGQAPGRLPRPVNLATPGDTSGHLSASTCPPRARSQMRERGENVVTGDHILTALMENSYAAR
jgi:hypothetical protein